MSTRYALSFCDDRPLTPGERKALQRRLPMEASGLPIRAIALLAGGDNGCLPSVLRVNGEEVDVWSKSGSRWYAEGPGVVAFDAEAQISLEVKNNGTVPARFCGVLLFGDWSRSDATDRPLDSLCSGSHSCVTPSSGGACQGCNYPRAYAHPDSLLDAFRVNDVYVQGTAMTVYPDYDVPPGLVQIVQRDGSQCRHTITPWGSPSAIIVDSMLANASLAQLSREGVSPLAALGSGTAADLLETGALLLRTAGPESSRLDLAQALIEGVANLIVGGYSGSVRRELRRILEDLSVFNDEKNGAIRSVASDVRTLLRELDRDDRIRAVARSPRNLLVDDCRSRVNWMVEGPFFRPVSRIRVALLPGEADHVRIYDLKVGIRDAYPIGVSVIHRVPGYGPDTVREDGPLVDLGSRITRRYLPGSMLAGRLRDGAGPWNPDDPYALQSKDLLGGVWVELETPLPTLSYAYLVYEVVPGRAMVAAVEPE